MAAVTDDGRRREEKRKRGITWDEQTIAEHDLLRGTRQRIDEPKTPYEHTVLSDDETMVSPSNATGDRAGAGGAGAGGGGGIDAMGELHARLAAMAGSEAAGKSRWDSDSDTEPTAEEQAAEAEKAKAFAERRKAHYNEYERMKAWRAAHAAADDEEDDEDDSGDESKQAAASTDSGAAQ